jgi:hypothetical protein
MKRIAAVIALLSGLFAAQAALAQDFPVTVEHTFGSSATVPAIPR